MIYVFLGIIALVLVYLFISYNSFIKLTNSVKEAFATMDVYLKKRWDLIPSLVEVVKGYQKHESSTLENVVKLRNLSYDKLSILDKINTNEQLTSDLSKLLAVAENYPDLKANQNFLELSTNLTRIEDEIANSRKYYNAVVRKLNTQIQMFPSNVVAKIFRFKLTKMFEIDASEKNNVKVEM